VGNDDALPPAAADRAAIFVTGGTCVPGRRPHREDAGRVVVDSIVAMLSSMYTGGPYPSEAGHGSVPFG
jgi:hypothetical protein